MNPSINTAPLADRSVDNIQNADGVLESLPALDLELPDSYIIQTLHTRIDNSIAYWNELNGFNLKNQRIRNVKAFNGRPIRKNILYYDDNEYSDNEVFVGVDAMVAYSTARPAQPEVYPFDSSKNARMWAVDLEKYLHAHSKKFHLEKKTEMAVLNLLLKHVGIISLDWDPDHGENGEIIPRVVNPDHMILDKNFKLGENPTFTCEVIKDSLEALVSKFPDKEREILQLFSVKRKGPQNISREIAWRKVYFTYYDKDNKPCEAVASYVGKIVLEKKKTPHWLYEGEGENFLDIPVKPYIFFNLVNDGDHGIDFTGPVDQAIPQQISIDTEGQQIADNLMTANGSRVVDAELMDKGQAEDWDERPNQTVVVEVPVGKTLENSILHLPPHTISNELIADKKDARDTLHGLLGTPSQFRGDDTDQTKTASEAALIKNQASGRQDKLVRAIDNAMEDYYNLLTQFMTVYYTKNHMRTINGGDGNFDHVEMHRDKIRKGMTVTVQTGTTLAFDKARQEAVAQNAAQLGFLSPYDYFRLMHMDQPQKLYDNLIKFKSNPQQLAVDLGDDAQDRDAIKDFAALIDGEKVELRDEMTYEYVDQLRVMLVNELSNPNSVLKINKRKNLTKVTEFIDKCLESLQVKAELNQMTQSEEQNPKQVTIPQVVQSTFQTQPMPPQPMGQQGLPQPPMMQQSAQPGQPPMAQPGGIQELMQRTAPGAAPNLNPSRPMPAQGVAGLPPQ